MTVRADTTRGVAIFSVCAAGATWLWSVRVPAPRWSALWSTTGPPTEMVDAIGFALWCMSTAAVAYLAVAAALHLTALACARRSVAPRLRRVTDRLTPRWMAVATVGVMTGSAWVAPHAGASTASNGGDRRPDIVLEIVTEDDDADPDAPRTMLPWASQLHRAASTAAPPTTSADPTVPTTPPTSTAPTTLPTSTAPTTLPTATSLPAPPAGDPSSGAPAEAAPRLEALDGLVPPDARVPGPDQLPPPLVIDAAPDSPVGAGGSHVVVTGESFWSIAERVVAERALPVPVASYWRLLVEANRDRLVDPANPDLLFPGQQLILL